MTKSQDGNFANQAHADGSSIVDTQYGAVIVWGILYCCVAKPWLPLQQVKARHEEHGITMLAVGTCSA